MKLTFALPALLATCVSAGLYTGNDATGAPKQDIKPKSFFNFPSFDVESILTSGPVASLIAKAGFNITEKLAQAKEEAAKTGWSPEIPLITDENYRELVVEEPLALDEVDKRVWFILITVPNADPISKFVDEKFEEAYNLTRSSPELALPHVKWARINYLDVTAITTRWWVWKAPMLVLLRKGGQELRFYSPRQIRMVPETIVKFLQTDGWKETPTWSGILAPGGALEPYMDTVSVWTAKSYTFVNSVPKWIMLLATGALGSILLNLMHRTSAPKPNPQADRTNGTEKQVRIASEAKQHDTATAVRHSARLEARTSSLTNVNKDRTPSPARRQSSRAQPNAKKQ